MKFGYSAFEHRYFAATGRDPFANPKQRIEYQYSEIQYCRPSDDPNDPPCAPSTISKTLSNYWYSGLLDARRTRRRL